MTLIITLADLQAMNAPERRTAMAMARRGQLVMETGERDLWRLPAWTPQPKQAEFLDCPADELLYGGAAGGGKSESLLNFSIRRRKEYPGSRGLIIRRTLAELKKGGGLIDRSHELLAGKARYHSSDHRWTFPDGGVIEFGYCERDPDVYKYQSSQYHDICLDEAGQLTGFIIRYLLSRCRSADRSDLVTKVRLAANPGGPGHIFLKSRYVDPAPPGVVWTPPVEPGATLSRTRCFIPAKLQDNPILTTADPYYAAFLASLPEKERKALMDGDWNAFSGQFFSEWSEAVHVVTPFEIPKGWARQGALDWGFQHPTVIHFSAVDPEGYCFIYHELVLRRHYVAQIVERIRDVNPDLRRLAAGPDVFTVAKEHLGGPTIAEEFQKHGIVLDNVMKGRTRVHGWQQMHNYLKYDLGDDGQLLDPPRVRVFKGACPSLCEQMPAMVPSDKDREDMAKVDVDPTTGEGGDDAVDTLRHFCMSRPRLGRPDDGPVVGRSAMAALQAKKDAARRQKKQRALR